MPVKPGMKRLHLRYFYEGWIDVPEETEIPDTPCDMKDMPDWFDPRDVELSNLTDIDVLRITRGDDV